MFIEHVLSGNAGQVDFCGSWTWEGNGVMRN